MAGDGKFDHGWFRLVYPSKDMWNKLLIIGGTLIGGAILIFYLAISPAYVIPPYDEMEDFQSIEASESNLAYKLRAEFASEADNWLVCEDGQADTLRIGNRDGGILYPTAGGSLAWQPTEQPLFDWETDLSCTGQTPLGSTGEWNLIVAVEDGRLEVLAMASGDLEPWPDVAFAEASGSWFLTVGSGFLVAAVALVMGAIPSSLAQVQSGDRDPESQPDTCVISARTNLEGSPAARALLSESEVEKCGQRVLCIDHDGDGSTTGLALISTGDDDQTDIRSWMYRPRQPADWDLDDLLRGEGELIAEHPQLVGTPTPAIFTTNTILAVPLLSLAAFMSWHTWLMMSPGTFDGILFGIFGLLLPFYAIIHGIRGLKRHTRMKHVVGTETTTISDLTPGRHEVVGQVRPSRYGSVEVRWGPDIASKEHSMDGVVAYEIHKQRRVSTGKSSHWVTDWKYSHSIPFVIHDGTAGVLADPETFHAADWGSRRSHRVGSRRWNLRALRLGDPVYARGEVMVLSPEETEQAVGRSTAWTWGMQFNGSHPLDMIERGTEMALMGTVRSFWEDVGIPFMVALTFVIPWLIL